MTLQTSLCVFIAIVMLWMCSYSHGYKFYVGGKDGWVINPSESYSHWAQRNRFQVNDTLVFKFKKGEDSALVVTKENYEACNVNSPIKSITDESEYKFERSGPHYFISGKSDHCNKGQKIIIVVLAVRRSLTPTPPTTPSSPTTPGPVPSPPEAPLTPGLQAPTPSPVVPDSPPQSEKKNSGVVYTSSLVGVVLSVVIGLGVFLG